MADYDEYNKDRANRLKAIVKGQAYKSLPSRRTVRDVPAAFRSHIEAIADRAKDWKAMPYYIRDNFKNGVISGGLLPSIPQKTQMPGTTAKPPQPCTEFDGEIASYKTWAYTFGLDVSALDRLRTSGDRAGLHAELKRLQKERFNRQAEWIAARTEVKDFAVDKAQGFPDIQKEAEAILNANEIRTTNYYGDCISRLKAFFASLPGKLAAAKAKAATSYSPMMPDELKKGAAHLRGDDYEYSREFFDLLKEKPKLEIRHQNKGSYESMHGKLVVFDNDTRFVASPWMRKSIAYHEFGHAIADQRNLLYTKEVTDLRTKQIARLRTREKATIWAREWGTNPKTGKWDKVKVRKEVSQMRAKTIADRLDYLYSRIREKTENDPIFKRYGMTKADVIEQICAAQDTLKSLINSVGWGHSTAYFKQAGHSEHEYLAHCFENAFIGNRVFQLYMPTEYAEMIALAKSFKF